MQLFGEKGQSLLIVVLVMVVALTVGLSVASRSIINLRITSEEQSSQSAFSAAEAGIEKALQISSTGTVITDQTIGANATIKKTVITPVGGDKEFLVNNGTPVAEDDGVDVWLSHYPDYASPLSPQFFSVYWGTTSNSCSGNTASAMEIIVLSGSKVNPVSKRFTFDPCQTRANSNQFSPITSPTNVGAFIRAGKTFQYRTPDNFLNGVSNIFIVRVIPLYASAPIAIYTCNNGGNNCTTLPLQGKQIDSTGIAGDVSQPTVRKITYFQGYPKLPSEFFQYVLFSSQK